MNYLNYTQENIPLGKDGWLANIFSANKNTDNWNKQEGSVTIGGKTYSTKDRNDVVALQDYLIDKGYNLGVTKGTGYFGKNTQAALNKHFASPVPVTTQSSTQPQPKTSPSFFTNAKNTVASWFTKDEKPVNSWDKSTGVVSLDGKTYNTSNRNDVVALQNYLVGKGYNVGKTGADGQFGRNTGNALNQYISGTSPVQKVQEKNPTFDEWLYLTGASKYGSNLWDEIETLGGSILGITTQSGEGTRRQALAQMMNPVKLKDGVEAVHYDAAKRYLGEQNGKKIGEALKDNDWKSITRLPWLASNYTLGQNNRTSEENLQNGGAGWASTSDGGYELRDGTDYHMFTYKDPQTGKSINVSQESNPELYQELMENGNLWQDLKSGIYNPMALFENMGTRKGWSGGKKEISMSADDIAAYRQEYENMLNDPQKLEEFYQLRNRLRTSKRGGTLNYLNYSK